MLPLRLPLVRPLVTSSARLERREGFVLILEGEGGQWGQGEASPVWWADGESLAATRTALDDIVAAAAAGGLDADRLRELVGGEGRGAGAEAAVLDGLAGAATRSARCALETALLDLEARRRGVAVATLLAPEPREQVAVGALAVSSDAAELGAEAARVVEAGFETVKMKLGALPCERDVERVETLRRVGRGRLRLRLDANRAWSLDAACELLGAIAGDDIEYVEEPLADPHVDALASLRERARVRIAADESIADVGDVSALARASACDVVVLKLARLGGPTATMRAARRAHELGLQVSVTDSIESAVGRAAAVHVAAALRQHSAVGLGGASLLARDVDGADLVRLRPWAHAGGPGLAVRRTTPAAVSA